MMFNWYCNVHLWCLVVVRHKGLNKVLTFFLFVAVRVVVVLLQSVMGWQGIKDEVY